MARQIKRFTEEQIERANRVDVVEYAQSMGHQLKRSGNWYKSKGQGGLYFNREANTWHWEVKDIGGVGAISLCMELENKTWVEAVKTLLNEEMEPIRHTSDWKPEPETPREFKLPDVNNTYKHMIAYLTKTRGIEASVLKAMIDRKYIYENTKKSCVFVGRDKEGKAHHASVRSTNTTGKIFKQDVPGSDKSYSFNIPGNSGVLNVFEAPIDLLSYVSLQKILGKQTKDSYVALGGTTDKALERFLKDYPNIQKIRICTDNDTPLNEKWDMQEMNKIAYIKRTNMVKGKETDLEMLFRTCNDYSRYVERNPDAETYYFSLSKDNLRFAQNGEVYAYNVVRDKQYMLYKSINDFEAGKGFQVSGKVLYDRYLYEMPAGDKAAARIHERYRNDYKVTRHRPANKDFNEDLLSVRQQQKMQERNTIQQQTQNQSINKTLLQESGISTDLIKWYDSNQNLFQYRNNMMTYEGSSEMMIVCENPNEVMAFMEIDRLNYNSQNPAEPYKPNDHFVTYSDVQQIAEYINKHPDINVIGVATGRSEHGTKIFNNLQSLQTHNIAVGRMPPKLTTYLQDLQQMKVLETAIEQTPIEDLEPDMVAGMEI